MIMSGLEPFSAERAFIAVFLSWFLSQLAKVVRGGLNKKKFDFRWLFDAGGMPSSHSATVASLATVVGLYYGFRSIPFLIVLIICLITMFDAAGVRRNVGRQAKTLNIILDEFHEKGHIQEGRVKELLGHTPIEVFVGAFVGIILATLICG